MKHADILLDEMRRNYGEKIEKVYKHRREILFKNGDRLNAVTTNHTDGLRADVAIGPNAFAITCASKQPKRIWEYADLNNYLKSF